MIHKHRTISSVSFLSLCLVLGCNIFFPNQPEHPTYFDKVFAVADSLRVIGDSLSMRYLDSAYRAFPRAGDLDLYRKYDLEMEMASFDRSDFITANRYADSMLLATAPFAGDKQYAAKYGLALLKKGDAMVRLNKYDEAIGFYHRGKECIQNIPDSCTLTSRYSGQLGSAFYNQQKYHQAITCYLQAIQELSGCRPMDAYEKFDYEAQMLNDVAISYRNMHMSDSAFFYFHRGLNFIAANEGKFPESAHLARIAIFKSLAHGNMGLTYQIIGNYGQAEKELIASILPPSVFHGFDNTILDLADLYLNHMNDMGKALETLQRSRAALDTIAHQDLDDRLWYQLKSEYLDKIGDSLQAYRYYRYYVRLNDSIRTHQEKFREVDISKRFEELERQQELMLLKKDNQFQKVYLLIAVGFSIMVLVILLLIWLNAKRSRKDLHIIGLHNKHLESTLESLEQRNRDYDHVIKVLAHDLRNPVGGIDGMAVLLTEEETLSEEGQSMLTLIHASCNQILRLIHELLESKSTPESRQLNMTLSDMSILLTDCVALLRFRSDEKKQQIRLGKIPTSLVLMDPDKMWRVFNNLIANAIKFSPERSVIRVSAEMQTGKLVVCVADQGVGIPFEIQDKVFDTFTRAGRAGTGGEKSFGLGLSICKQIVEVHGGSLWLESKPNAGTRFYVAIPVLQVEETFNTAGSAVAGH